MQHIFLLGSFIHLKINIFMSFENCIEKNIEIAKFMGGVYRPDWTSIVYLEPSPTIVFTKETAPTPHSSYNWGVELLQYHESMDWLYPVIVKINSLALDNFGEMGVYITPNSCAIGSDQDFPISETELDEYSSLHETIWEAVYNFILYYNKYNLTHNIN